MALDSSQRFLVALERAEGEDPDEGFAAQALWRLALKMQLAGPQKRALLVRRANERLRLQRGTAPVLQYPR